MSFTPLTGIKKTDAVKSGRQLKLEVKEELADTAVAAPPAALKSLVLDIEGENDEGAHGTVTVGQKITGKLILYAGSSAIRTFAHELVTKTVKQVQMVTNSGQEYTLSTPDGEDYPAVEFAYEKVNLVTETNKPTVISILITGFRDNVVIN